MGKKIAVAYCGAVRTAYKTLPFTNRNFLSDADVSVFAVLNLERNSEFAAFPDFPLFLKEQLGEKLKKVKIFNQHEWTGHVNNLSAKTETTDWWKYYIRTSGAVYQHIHIYECDKLIDEYEKETGVKFDYVYRIRPDLVINRPINKFWENIPNLPSYDKESVVNYCLSLMDPLKKEFITAKEPGTELQVDINNPDLERIHDHQSLVAYIEKSNFILVIRGDIIFCLTRDNFRRITNLAHTYGQYRAGDPSRWPAPEEQLRGISTSLGLDFFNFATKSEVSSSSNQDPNAFFDSDGEPIQKNDLYYFMKRK